MAPGSYFASRCKAGLIAGSMVRIRWMISPAAENSWPAPLQPGRAAGRSPLGKAACAAPAVAGEGGPLRAIAAPSRPSPAEVR
jgi:hypothetical protein